MHHKKLQGWRIRKIELVREIKLINKSKSELASSLSDKNYKAHLKLCKTKITKLERELSDINYKLDLVGKEKSIEKVKQRTRQVFHPNNYKFIIPSIIISLAMITPFILGPAITGYATDGPGQAPEVSRLFPDNNIFNISANISINATINDSSNISRVFANITDPDGNITQVELQLDDGNSSDANYSTSYILPNNIFGEFNVTFIANDTSNNVNTTEFTYFNVSSDNIIPYINISTNTPENNSNQTRKYIPINLTTNGFGLNHYTFVIFNDSLVFWMTFNDTNSSSDPTDISNNSNNGSLIDNATINTTGIFGSALHLDGSGDFVNISDDDTLDFENESFTISVWFNADSSTQGTDLRNIISKKASEGSTAGWTLRIDDSDNLEFFVGDSISSTTAQAGAVGHDSWHHAVVVADKDALNYSLYINGVYNASATKLGNVSNNESLRIGSWGNGSNPDYFNGSIDDVLMFNRALNLSEIQSIYNSTSTPYFNNFTNLDNGRYLITSHTVTENGLRNQTSELEITIVDLETPTLLSPINNSTETDRTPQLIWNNTQNNITQTLYEVQIDNDSDFSSPMINVSSISSEPSNTTYNTTLDLEVDTSYHWRVRAYEDEVYSNWTNDTFHVASGISLVIDDLRIDFGVLSAGTSVNTTDDSYDPMVIKNTGNIPINILINASELYNSTTADIPGLFQFMIEDNETSSYTSAFTDWTNLNGSQQQGITGLKYENDTSTGNSAKFNVLVRVPSDEKGNFEKESVIYFEGSE